jgi:hypothetical protein
MVGEIPKPLHVASVRDDVINDGSCNSPALLFARSTERMLREKPFRVLLPTVVVAALVRCASGDLIALACVRLARPAASASGMSAWLSWSLRHFSGCA